MAKHKKNKRPRVSGVVTAVESATLFVVDGETEVHVGPKTSFSGVAVNSTGLDVGHQVAVVGHKNKHKELIADKVNVETATGPEPVEPEDPEEDGGQTEPVTPNPPDEPAEEEAQDGENVEPAEEPEGEDSGDSDSNDSNA